MYQRNMECLYRHRKRQIGDLEAVKNLVSMDFRLS